jgi:hypothetical protein
LKNQDIDFEIFDDIDDQELLEISNKLNSYNVSPPEQEQIDSTIEMLRLYMPAAKTSGNTSKGKIYWIIINALNEIKFMNKYFWLISFMLFLTGFYIVQKDIEINFWYKPYILIVLLAPVPFLLGVIEVFRGRDEGMLELELSCKVTERDIMLSRLLVTGIYNIILNTLLSGMLSTFNIGIDIFRAAFFWITPFTVVCGLALVLSSKLRGGYAATVLISSWVVFVITVLSQRHIIEELVSINMWAYIFLSALGLLFTGYQIRLLLNKNADLTGGQVVNDSKN